MATVHSDPRSVPDPRDERVIRRIMRLTIFTLAGMLLALISVTVLAAGAGLDMSPYGIASGGERVLTGPPNG
jgi:hypothetical protein